MSKIKYKNVFFDRLVILVIIFVLVFTSVTVSSNVISYENYNNFNYYPLPDDCDDFCDEDDDGGDPTLNNKPKAYIDVIEPNPAKLHENVFFSGYGEDIDGSIIAYMWHSDLDGLINMNSSFNTNKLSAGIHIIYFLVQDDEEEWSDPATFYLEIIDNQPPEEPIISGEINPKVGDEYGYTFVSSDPNGDNLSYYIDWGDGSFENWVGFYESNDEIIIDHLWSEKGTFIIKAKAKDVYNDESDWGTLEVRLSKNLFYNHFLFFRLFDKIKKIIIDNFL